MKRGMDRKEVERRLARAPKSEKRDAAFRKAIRQIPKGKVATYGQVAAAAGFPRAARQVVWALRAFRGLPWHRVVGAGGAIRVPGEEALEQRMLLELEGVAFRGRRVHMKQHQWRRI